MPGAGETWAKPANDDLESKAANRTNTSKVLEVLVVGRGAEFSAEVL